MNRKLFYFFLLFTFSLTYSNLLKAQSISPSVIATTGNYSVSGGYSLSSTTGELVVPTFTNSTYVLTQGFQQPNKKLLNVDDYSNEIFNVSIFPNPFADNFNIEISNANHDNFIIEIFDLLGQRLNNNFILNDVNGTTKFEINTESLPIAVYMLRISTNDNKFQKVIKINKAYY